MTLFDFQLLSLSKQIEVLHSEGVYVGKRKSARQTMILYQVETFYVEVFYFRYRCFVERISCSQSTAVLNPYLQQIDVGELVKIC